MPLIPKTVRRVAQKTADAVFFLVASLTYPVAGQGKTWAEHPKVRVLDPAIADVYPLHPHIFRRSDPQDAWACPVSPQDNRWTWKSGATVAYLDQVAIWLLKTQVWATTGVGAAGLGKWVGPATGLPSILRQ